MTNDTSTVRLYERDISAACERFVQRMWPATGHRQVTESGAADADPRSPRVLFVKGGEVLGHLASLPVTLSVAGRPADAHWVVGLMVVPEYRNRPIAPLLVKKMTETVEIGLTLHVEEAVTRVFEGLHWRHLGVIPQYVRLLNAGAVVRAFSKTGRAFLPMRSAGLWPVVTRTSRVLAPLANAVFTGLAAVGRLAQRRRPGTTVVEERSFSADHAALAERVKEKFAVWVCRDERYLSSRYRDEAGDYRLLACRAGKRLLGYCVVKLRRFAGDSRMGDLRLGTLVDCIFDPDDAGVVDLLVRSAVELCRSEKMDVVFCSASHRAMRRHLLWNGFLKMRGTLHVAYHDRTATIGADVPLDAWHVMRGDSDAAQNC
jgi:hypothetical protein